MKLAFDPVALLLVFKTRVLAASTAGQTEICFVGLHQIDTYLEEY